MKRLIVYLQGQPVGELDQDDSGLLTFQYDQSWLNSPIDVPLSRSLPLQKEVFRGKQARPFFAGILPDEGPRAMIAKILGISERNDFAMLERIGGECAGAATLLSEGVDHPAFGETRVRPFSAKELQAIISELPRRPLMAGTEGLRLSLAGSQSKLPVVVQGDKMGLPLGNAPSTHIIKPEPERFPGLVANETLCMTLAKTVGLNVPAIQAGMIGKIPYILVQRYDRDVDPNGITLRVHQEDFCQALGFPPEKKYQQEGGPLIRDCIALLRDWSSIPAIDIRDFIDGLIFNVLIGNADAHAKNYSMIYREGQRRLAPLYDLVCTLAWPELSKTPAMKIGKSDSMKSISPANWEIMAEECKLSWPMLRGRIVALSERTLIGLKDEKVKCLIKEMAQVENVVSIIQRNSRDMAKLHSEG